MIDIAQTALLAVLLIVVILQHFEIRIARRVIRENREGIKYLAKRQ